MGNLLFINFIIFGKYTFILKNTIEHWINMEVIPM